MHSVLHIMVNRFLAVEKVIAGRKAIAVSCLFVRLSKNIARIANAVQVTICLLVSTSVY